MKSTLTAKLRALGLVGYYIVILLAILLLHGSGSFTTPPFVYQGF